MDTNLIILIWVSIVAIIVVCGFLIKLLIDLSKLIQSMTKASDMIQEELEPTLKELNEAAESVKSIAGVTKEQAENFQKTIKNIAGATSTVGRKVQGLFDGILKGISFGIKLFRK